jgi:hypothetical protein
MDRGVGIPKPTQNPRPAATAVAVGAGGIRGTADPRNPERLNTVKSLNLRLAALAQFVR